MLGRVADDLGDGKPKAGRVLADLVGTLERVATAGWPQALRLVVRIVACAPAAALVIAGY